MKKSYKIAIVAGVMLFTLVIWSLGFVMGNSAATLRTGRITLHRNTVILDALDKGNTENARGNCKAMIVGGYHFLQSKPFWLVALREQMNIDSEEYFKRAYVRAEELSRNYRPLDEVLRESFGPDVTIEYNIK